MQNTKHFRKELFPSICSALLYINIVNIVKSNEQNGLPQRSFLADLEVPRMRQQSSAISYTRQKAFHWERSYIVASTNSTLVNINIVNIVKSDEKYDLLQWSFSLTCFLEVSLLRTDQCSAFTAKWNLEVYQLLISIYRFTNSDFCF